MALAALLLASNAGAVQPPVADQQAAALALAHRERVQQAFAKCESVFRGRGGQFFSYSWNFWEKDNERVAVVAEDVSRALPDKTLAAPQGQGEVATPTVLLSMQQATPLEQFQRCESLAKPDVHKSIRFALVYPSESSALERLRQANPKWRNVVRNADLTIGCMKRDWNTGGRNASAARLMCECVTETVVRSVSDEQFDSWVSGIASPKPGGELEPSSAPPWLLSLAPVLAECKTQR
jgi:hypothetical protein